MNRPKRNKKKAVSLCENDGSNEDFSNGSDDEWSPDSEKFASNSGNSTLEESQNSMHTIEDDDDGGLPFNTTAGFALKIIQNYKMSKHPVWGMFGQLLKADKLVVRVKDRFFCQKCFDKNKFKR